jgi:hypothetical protein
MELSVFNNRVTIGPMLVFSLMAAPTAAFAGAWTLDAGTGQAVVTWSFSRADKGFDAGGNILSAPRYDKSELQALLEYGATDRLTLILWPGLQHVGIGAPNSVERTGLGYTEFGARYRLLRGDSWVFSTQTTLRVPGTLDRFNPAAVGYTDPEFDARALFGYSFSAGPYPAFFDLQVAQRFRSGAPPNEFRADATLGVRPGPNWRLLAQSFNVISEGAGDPPFPSYNYHKLQMSVVYDVTPRWALQVGAVTTYAGRNALQENGLVFGSWHKF